MRTVVSALLVMFQMLPAGAQTCATPPEKQAFEVIALKSELMVGALSCGDSAQYDSFMTAFQPFIMAQQQLMDGYFQRAGGLAGQSNEDSYVTLLANSQSQAGAAQGASFCAGAPDAFNTVLALKSPADLTRFVAGDGLPEPISLTACAPVTPPSATPVIVAQAGAAQAGAAQAGAAQAGAARDLVRAEPLPPPRRTAAAGSAHPKIRVALRARPGTPAVKKSVPVPSPVMVTQMI